MKGPIEQRRRRVLDVLGLPPILRFFEEHKVPPDLAGRRGWLYVLGSATMVSLILQVVTGVALATMYVPSAQHARQSLLDMNATTFGSLLRGIHYFGASAMVVLVLLHMTRVFLAGSYKFPRQVNWMSGVILLVLTLLMALTGQLLRWDVNGVYTALVSASFLDKVPLIGDELARFALAGPHVGGATLPRFFTLHVLIIPLTIGAVLAVHLYLLAYHGISERPSHPLPADPIRYKEQYKAEKNMYGVRYWPDSSWRESVAGVVVVSVVVALAVTFGPKGPAGPPDLTRVTADPRPDWFLRWYYALLYMDPGELDRVVMVYGPLLAVTALLVFPVFFGTGDRDPRRRPWAPAVVVVAVLTFGGLTYFGAVVPWSPEYETEPLGAAQLGPVEKPVLTGAHLFEERGCQYCHQVLDRGGQWGPNLTRVYQRLSSQEITIRIVQGYRDMPSYRDTLSRDELAAILTFLEALPDAEQRRTK